MNGIILETSAFVITLFCLIDCLRNRRSIYLPFPKGFNKKLANQHFVYMGVLVFLMLSAFFSVAEGVFENYFAVSNRAFLLSLSEGYFICHNFLLILFVIYVLDITGFVKGRGPVFLIVFLIPHIIGQALTLINPFTGWLFYIDENLIYERGPYIWSLYVIAIIYVFSGSFIFLLNRKKISKIDRSSTTVIIFVGILGIVIQGIWALAVELFFEAVACLGFMLLLEERKVRDRGGRGSRIKSGFIMIIALIFVAVISVNISVIYTTGTSQTEQIGTIQLGIIKSDLQENLSDAESNLLKYSMSIEQLLSDEAPFVKLEGYIGAQKDYYMADSKGECFSVYAASSDWTIIPEFDWPDDYHATERVWYVGAKEKAGEINITEPYIDADTGNLCYTLSILLSDNDTVTAMDFNLSGVQDSIRKMGEGEDRVAMIVSDNGTIVGHSNESYVGKGLADVMSDYSDMFERVKASDEHMSFKTKIGGKEKVIFSSETSNGWYLILIADSASLYEDNYRQMILLAAIDILMVIVIIVFYLVSVNNQEKAENALASTENFIKGLSDKLRAPLNDILAISENSIKEGVPADQETMLDIRESGKKLSETLENLFSYSRIIKSGQREEAIKRFRDAKKMSFKSMYLRNCIIGVLVGAMAIGLLLCVVSASKWGNSRLNREADKYNNEVAGWMQRQNSILSMFADMISVDPSLMDDYDAAVKWLDDIGSNYSELSFVYLGNPYNKEHAIIMNNGWVPDPDYKVGERQWYIDTEKSADGRSISAPYFDAQTGLYCITFSEVVNSKDGEFLGVFAIDCYIDKLIEILSDSYKSDGYAFLVDKDGVIINHPNKQYEMIEGGAVNIEDTIYADVYHSGEIESFRDYDGRYVTCVAQKSELSGSTVIVVQSWWSIYGTIFLLCMVFLFLLVICIAAVIHLMNRFLRWQEETNLKLVEAKDAAVSAGKAKSGFFAQMSHEIRTPINAVLGMNEMILRESDDESIREYATNIRTAGQNLLGLVNGILDFSKLEEGRMEIIPVRYDSALMVANMINSIEKRALDKGLEFYTDIDENIPAILFGDDMRVSQVAMNLLTNAVKYTREGRVDLKVSGKKIDKDTYRLFVQVKDTGIGIKEEDMDKLFDTFTRLEVERNRNIEGTGLGMAIVTRLLKMMDSKLNVKSVYGEGSEFSFEVDQTIIDSKPMGNIESRIKAISSEDESEEYLFVKGGKILVVDDNEMNLKVIKNLLKLNGVKPDMAGSGAEALEMLRTNRYDIVLLDHMMPEMDGVMTLMKAKEENLIKEGTTVIALTANAVSGAKEKYLEAGFDDYLSKPVEVKALEGMIKKYLPEGMTEYRKKTETAPAKEDADEEVLEFTPGGDDVLEFDPMEEEESAGSKKDKKSVYASLNEKGISTEDGLRYSAGDEDFYLEILNDYVNTHDAKKKEIEDAFKDNDLETYRIKVHALKSVSKTVGATDVFEKAKALEEAAKEENSDYIAGNHGGLMDAFDGALEAISSALKEI